MAKITYVEKVGVEPKIVHINQVWDDDMNEIKEVVNKNAESGNVNNTTDFTKANGTYVNTPNNPYTNSPIPLVKTDASAGGISAIWFSGSVLSKNSFTGGTVTMFSGLNNQDELCRIFIDYDVVGGAFSVNIQTGFTGDLPVGGDSPAQMTITDLVETSIDHDPPNEMTITNVTNTDASQPAKMTITSII